MLLVRRRDTVSAATPLRSVFSRDDSWLSTGDLFRRDGDGDFWFVGAVAEVIRTADGPVVPVPVEDAVAALEAVDLAVAYGLPQPDGTEAVAVAVTLRAASRWTPAPWRRPPPRCRSGPPSCACSTRCR